MPSVFSGVMGISFNRFLPVKPFASAKAFSVWSAHNCDRCKKSARCRFNRQLWEGFYKDGYVSGLVALGIGADKQENIEAGLWDCPGLKFYKKIEKQLEKGCKTIL